MKAGSIILAATGIILACGAVVPAKADNDWRRHEQREAWRYQNWRQHEWRERQAWAYRAPPVVVAPPQYYSYYTPPPVYNYGYGPGYGYGYSPGVTFGFTVR